MQVMVSGCFDMLHSGHVAFLEAAARLEKSGYGAYLKRLLESDR